MECLRLTEQKEILGGDLYYFGPMEFYGKTEDYDLVETMKKQILISSQKKREEGEFDELEGGSELVPETERKLADPIETKRGADIEMFTLKKID